MSLLQDMKRMLLGLDKEELQNWMPEEGDALPTMSDTEAVITQALLGGETYGLDLVKSSKGRLKQGTIYVTLQRMEEKGFIDSREEERPADSRRIPRRLYAVTGLGERVFRAKVIESQARRLALAWGGG